MGRWLVFPLALALTLLAPAASTRAAEPRPVTAAIYGGGPLYAGGTAVMDDLRGSGFTAVVAWTLHLSAAGELNFNDQRIVTGGRYVGDPAWPARLAGLKRGGSVNRLTFSVGSAGVGDFHQLQALIQSGGIGPGSPLRRSFLALKQAIPAIDGFDLDDEDLLDPATTRAFSAMLGELGFGVSFCPYDQMDFWVDCLHDLEASAPGLVTGFNLQCYAGGAWNEPQAWISRIAKRMGDGFDAAGLVQPGLWSRHGDGCQDGDTPGQAAARFAAWRPQGIRGGFIWLYDDILHCRDQADPNGPWDAGSYARATTGGLGEVGAAR